MRRIPKFLVPVLSVGLLFATMPAAAESSSEARQWLDKLAGAFKKGPFSLDYSASVHVTHEDQTMEASMNGHMVQADPTHFRMDMSMQSSIPGAEKPLEVSMIGIADGATMWAEMKNPMMGGLHVMKVPLAGIEELSETNPMAANMSHMDPVSQVEEMAKVFDFAVVETTADRVTLRAEVTPEALAKMGKDLPPGDPSQFKTLVLVLDRKSALPSEIRMGGETPVLVMRFDNVKVLSADALEAGTFRYEPPEGAQVIDLGAMMAAKPQAGD